MTQKPKRNPLLQTPPHLRADSERASEEARLKMKSERQRILCMWKENGMVPSDAQKISPTAHSQHHVWLCVVHIAHTHYHLISVYFKLYIIATMFLMYENCDQWYMQLCVPLCLWHLWYLSETCWPHLCRLLVGDVDLWALCCCDSLLWQNVVVECKESEKIHFPNIQISTWNFVIAEWV
jgi:hypothetical protein